MDKGWQDTLNPMTLMPWTGREEYMQFWRLPQQQREQRIRASRNAMANPAGAPQSAPQTAEKRHPGLKNGIAHCLALEARNCAPGHPMSER